MSEHNQENKHKKNLLDKIFGFVGIHFPRQKKDIIHFSQRFLIFLLIIFGCTVIFFMGFAKFSTSPNFCGMCHIMKPYYNAWKTSTHNMVSCVDCHYPPDFTKKLEGKIAAISQVVKYVTRTYGTKPYAEIEDASCLRRGCHEKRLLQGKVMFKRGIIFDHKDHLTTLRRGMKLKCTSCHSQIVIGNHIAVTEQVCFICHFKNIDIINLDKMPPELKKMASCDNCHGPPKGDITVDGNLFNHADFVSKGVKCIKCHIEIIQGKGEVPEDRCLNCHGEPEYLEKYNDDVNIHKNHVTLHKVECYQCHLEIKHKVKTKVSSLELSCDNCHRNKHEGIKNMYMGKGGKGLSDNPNIMYTYRVDCVGCHIISKGDIESVNFNGETRVAGNISCKTCHGDDYDGMLDIWKKDIDKSLKTTNELLKEVESSLKKFVSEDETVQLEINRLLRDARHNIKFVEYANGVHNPDYALNMLNVANKYLESVKELVEKRK